MKEGYPRRKVVAPRVVLASPSAPGVHGRRPPGLGLPDSLDHYGLPVRLVVVILRPGPPPVHPGGHPVPGVGLSGPGPSQPVRPTSRTPVCRPSTSYP
jgi:hypothetical protein